MYVFAAEIGENFMEVQVIGDFPEAEARAFFEWKLTFSVAEPPPLDDASWSRIYEVCGGNAGSLLVVASEWTGASTLEGGTSPFSRAFLSAGGVWLSFSHARDPRSFPVHSHHPPSSLPPCSALHRIVLYDDYSPSPSLRAPSLP